MGAGLKWSVPARNRIKEGQGRGRRSLDLEIAVLCDLLEGLLCRRFEILPRLHGML